MKRTIKLTSSEINNKKMSCQLAHFLFFGTGNAYKKQRRKIDLLRLLFFDFIMRV